MRAGRPRTQGARGSRFLVLGSWFLVFGSGRPRSRHAQDCAYAGETPALPARAGSRACGRDARAPGTRRIARMRARRPRTRHRARIACMRAILALPTSRQDRVHAGGTPALPARAGLRACGRGRPRTQGACGSRFSVLGSRFGTPALPGGTWFSVPGSWFSVLGSWFLVLGSWFLVLDSGRPHTQGHSPP